MVAENDNDQSSKVVNLKDAAFKAIDDEAECEGASYEFSDMNRVVSEILKNRKSDPDDLLSKKRR